VTSLWLEILEEYDRRHCKCDDEIAWLHEQPNLRAAIDVAARAVDRQGRRHPHQFRIRRDAIVRARAALLVVERQLARAESFDEVFRIVTEQLRDVAGVGELYAYDTSFRIGAYLRLFPTRVYLHAGTRGGARALGLDCSKGFLDMNEVPAALRHRKAHEVEDILCIFKDRFSGLGPVAGQPSRRIVC